MKPSDLATVDAVISAYYEARPFRVGEHPDWDRFRSLFIPNASIVQAVREPGAFYVYGDIERYIGEYQATQKPSDEFSQVELARVTNSFIDIAHVFSSYGQGRAADKGNWPIRGVNSFHFARDYEGDWRITSWHWCEEDSKNPIPAELLPEE